MSPSILVYLNISIIVAVSNKARSFFTGLALLYCVAHTMGLPLRYGYD